MHTHSIAHNVIELNMSGGIDNTYERWVQFRKPIGKLLFDNNVKNTFPSHPSKQYNKLNPPTEYAEAKYERALADVHSLVNRFFVIFIAITGSVATGNATEDDDIDFFAVVRDHTAWIYRLWLYGRNLFNRKLNKKSLRNSKDRLCINFIVEERALTFAQHDLFTLNEILQMIPVYNRNFYNRILTANAWLTTDFKIRMDTDRNPDRHALKKYFFLLLAPVNWLAFILQLAFMAISRHNPEYKRLFKNTFRGTIEFWPSQRRH